MNREEILLIMGVLKAAYPAYYRDMSRRDAETVVALWSDMFSEDPVDLVAAAVKALIASDENGFPPHIGSVKAKLRQLTEQPQMTASEAWGSVMKAIRRSGYNSQQEFDKLPQMLQRLVGSPSQLKEWALMDAETVQSVVASNFQRSYQVRAKQEYEYQAIPQSVRQMIGAMADRMALEG